MAASNEHTGAATPAACSLRFAGYAATVFLASACLLVLEIVAGRLLAPYIGVSLYTWTSIIGVILAGLSLGNWIGGRWADRGAGEFAVGLTLAGAGASAFAVLGLLTVVAPVVQRGDLSLLGASFVLVATLFLLPALLLGVVTPLLTTLALRLKLPTGRTVGTLHALAALGSIAGTFATGFWLIQYAGTRAIVIGTALLLLALAMPFLRRRAMPGALSVLAVVAVMGGATWWRGGFADPCLRESNYFCIRVVDSSTEAPFGTARSLVLDHLVHSTNHKEEPRLLLAPYVHLMDELMSLVEDDASNPRLFFAGGGAYTQPRAARARLPDAEIVVAELDPAVTAVTAAELFFDPAANAVTVHHADARLVLAGYPDDYFDIVVTDVFHDLAVPYHLVTREHARLVSDKLRARGIYTLNVVDAFPDARLTKSLLKTLRAEFAYVDVFIDEIPERPGRTTLVVLASDLRRGAEVVHARRGLRRRWVKITRPLLATGTPLAELPLLVDDFVPVERLVTSLFTSQMGR